MDFVLESIVGVLLIATCGYCYVLSRRLRTLREGQVELLAVINKFDEASRRAETNLAQMQNSGLTMGRDIDAVTTRANNLLDELSVMVNAGDNIAGRIEGAMSEVRAIGAKRVANDTRAAS